MGLDEGWAPAFGSLGCCSVGPAPLWRRHVGTIVESSLVCCQLVITSASSDEDTWFDSCRAGFLRGLMQNYISRKVHGALSHNKI